MPKDATAATAAANREAVALYDMDDRQDFADADRGSSRDSRTRRSSTTTGR